VDPEIDLAEAKTREALASPKSTSARETKTAALIDLGSRFRFTLGELH
jgi:hypothetical protein